MPKFVAIGRCVYRNRNRDVVSRERRITLRGLVLVYTAPTQAAAELTCRRMNQRS